ncbi:MAG: ABC transporter substrate-binding protein [Dehalococcoidia bacterium]
MLIIALAAVLVAAAFALIACGDGGGESPRRTSGGLSGPQDRVNVVMWHSMTATTEASLTSIADEFNASQTKYHVTLVRQGGYSESFVKLRSSDPGDYPALVQLSDQFTQIMIDSKVATPIQDFVDQESYDLSDFEPKAINYYSVDDTLYAMPFNIAGPILYYDRQAFKDAGLDPDRPPRTLEEVRQYSERLVQRNDNGEVTRAGIALWVSPWIFEQMLAKQGALVVNNANGRTERATKAVFAGPEGKGIIEWWDQMLNDGLATYTGRSAQDALLQVASGRASMTIASTAVLQGAILAVTIIGDDPNRIGTGPMPAPEGQNGGITLGGAAFWVLNDRPDEEQQGAWEFIKFASSPQQQARWHADTGYMPSRVSAFDLPAAVQKREQYPQFATAIEQLRDSPDNPATNGALLGPFNAVRDQISRAFEQVLSGNADPDAALEAAAEAADKDIDEYNRTAP